MIKEILYNDIERKEYKVKYGMQLSIWAKNSFTFSFIKK